MEPLWEESQQGRVGAWAWAGDLGIPQRAGVCGREGENPTVKCYTIRKRAAFGACEPVGFRTGEDRMLKLLF